MYESAAYRSVIVKFCNEVYERYEKKDFSASDVSSRVSNATNRWLKGIGVIVKRPSKGVVNITLKEGTTAHGASAIVRMWRMAVQSTDAKHHLYSNHVEKASKDLAELGIENFEKTLSGLKKTKDIRDRITVTKGSTSDIAAKKILSELRIEHHAYYLLDEIYKQLRAMATSEDKKNLKKKLNNQKKINPDFAVAASKEILEAAASGTESSVGKILVAIAITTGRRRTEIVNSGRFMVDSATRGQHVTFSGQLKTKNRALFGDVHPYDIPVLIDRDLVLSAHESLRRLLSSKNITYIDNAGNQQKKSVLYESREAGFIDKVSQAFAHPANNAIRDLFECSELEFKDTRAIYTEIGYNKYKKPGEARSVYRTRVLGHASGDNEMSSQLNYETFELDKSIPKARVITGSDNSNPTYSKSLYDFLASKTETVSNWPRAKAAIRIHHWLISRAKSGLDPAEITEWYIRKNCRLDGKAVGTRSVIAYLDKMLELSKHMDEITAAAPVAADFIADSPDEKEAAPEEPLSDEQELDKPEPAKEPKREAQAKPGSSDAGVEKPVPDTPHYTAIQTGELWMGMAIINNAPVHTSQGHKSEADAKAATEKEYTTKQPSKPKMRAEKMPNGWWYAQILVDGETVADAMAKGSKSSAEREAWKIYQSSN